MERKGLTPEEQKELKRILGVEYKNEILEEKITKRDYTLLEVLDIARALKGRVEKAGTTWNDGIVVKKTFGVQKLIIRFHPSLISLYVTHEANEEDTDTQANFYFCMKKDIHGVYYTKKHWVALVGYPFIVCIHRKKLDIQILWPYSGV
jgi:hypothetical protein